MLERIDQVVIAVGDAGAATRTTARLLGRMPSWTSETPAAGARSSLFELGNAGVALVEPHAPGPIADLCRARLDRAGEGPCALILASDDLAGDRTRLAAAGVNVGEPGTLLEHDDPSGAWRHLELAALPLDATGGLPLLLSSRDETTEIRPPSAPLGDAAACVDRLDHAVVTTRDPERARALYGEKLGLRLALDRRFEERGLRLLFFRLGGATLELAARAAIGDPDERDEADIEAAHQRLAASGFPASPVREGHKPGTRVFTVDAERTHGVPTLFVSEASSG